MPKHQLYFGDNLDILRTHLPDESVHLIYIDPPFNTGKRRRRVALQVSQDPEGNRTGFQGRRYRAQASQTAQYEDVFESSEAYLRFLRPRIEEALRVLRPDGSFFLHIDCRESHYCKVMLDELFGRESFMNEIVWAYDYGGRSKSRWPAKHDNIFWYAKNPKRYTFNYEELDRIPYMAPGLVSQEKAARGKTPTDVWWHTIVATNGREKTGYPTQKPLGVLNRIVKAHSSPGDTLLDFFAGSGTFGEAAALHGRSSILIDNNPSAVETIMRRMRPYGLVWINKNADNAPSAQQP